MRASMAYIPIILHISLYFPFMQIIIKSIIGHGKSEQINGIL